MWLTSLWISLPTGGICQQRGWYRNVITLMTALWPERQTKAFYSSKEVIVGSLTMYSHNDGVFICVKWFVRLYRRVREWCFMDESNSVDIWHQFQHFVRRRYCLRTVMRRRRRTWIYVRSWFDGDMSPRLCRTTKWSGSPSLDYERDAKILFDWCDWVVHLILASLFYMAALWKLVTLPDVVDGYICISSMPVFVLLVMMLLSLWHGDTRALLCASDSDGRHGNREM